MLNFYTSVPRNASASYYYRLLLPFETARDLGMPFALQLDTNDSTIDPTVGPIIGTAKPTGSGNRDWKLEGTKKDSTGIRNRWSKIWLEYRKDPKTLPNIRGYRLSAGIE